MSKLRNGLLVTSVILNIIFIGGVLAPIYLSGYLPFNTGDYRVTPHSPDIIILQSWAFPDSYGQGIDALEIYQNSSGSWVDVEPSPYLYSDSDVLSVPGGCSIKIVCYSWLNSTLVGAGSGLAGKLYQRHYVIVKDAAESTVFSKQNFTYSSVDTGINPPLWYYTYYVILNFDLGYGQYYTVNMTYETFY